MIRTFSSPSRQQGITLLVGMIMLLLLTLIGIASFNLSRNDTLSTGNVQSRMQVTHAAMATIEDTLSTTQFLNTPADAIPHDGGNYCAINQNCYDVDGNKTTVDAAAVTVKLAQNPCIEKVQVLPSSAFPKPADPCVVGLNQNLGVEGAASNNSLCADSQWKIKATANDKVTATTSTVTTGVTVTIATDSASNAAYMCP